MRVRESIQAVKGLPDQLKLNATLMVIAIVISLISLAISVASYAH